jgi:UDP-N-acetylglucosamine 2-epimerase (non-hydrolysing)
VANKLNVSVVLGIRPDYIRTSLVLKGLKAHPLINATFISTGQHYDHELKGVFLEELGLPEPDITLDTKGSTHCEQHSKLILQLEQALIKTSPDVVLFLGDANAVIGSIVPLKMGIPIAHIEAGMRSFDWRMPEERNRVIIDRISDVMYVYHDNYKINLVREGINPSKILTVGNVIVDVLNTYREQINAKRWTQVDKYGGHYAVMTLHRSENVSDRFEAQRLIIACGKAAGKVGAKKVVLPEMPRLKALNLNYPDNFIIEKPMGFFDFACLEANAIIEFTDSGTNQETSAIQGTPAVIIRKSTERPETFKSGISILAFETQDIYAAAQHVVDNILKNYLFKDYKFEEFGNGNASQKIVDDLVERIPSFKGTNTPWHDKFIKEHFV